MSLLSKLGLFKFAALTNRFILLTDASRSVTRMEVMAGLAMQRLGGVCG